MIKLKSGSGLMVILAAVLGLLQCCVNGPDSKSLDAVQPGFYQGTGQDEFYNFYFKMDSLGYYEFRQYESDSTVLGQSMGNLRFENDSVYFTGTKSRLFQYKDNSRTTGSWSGWSDKANLAVQRYRMYSDIRADDFKSTVGGEWILFKKLGPPSSLWPKSRNEIQENGRVINE